MGFYLRKSISFGPLRVNFSKSGVGLSAGVKGFRVGTGPRGGYVHMGRGGLYYRQSLGERRTRSTLGSVESSAQPKPSRQEIAQDALTFHEIESAETSALTDASSQDIVETINGNLKKWPLWPLCLPFAFIGEIPALLSVVTACIIYITIDRWRRSTVIQYDIDADTEKSIQKFYDAFKEISDCQRIWHIESQAATGDRKKYFSGATALYERKVITVSNGVPNYIRTNINVPSIPVGKQILYFFPDKLFITEKQRVAAISYDTLSIHSTNLKFIEGSGGPQDGTIVDYSWKYENKKGGPDRRFKDNVRQPVYLYSEISFTSPTGLNERIQTSRKDVGLAFKAALATYLRSGALNDNASNSGDSTAETPPQQSEHPVASPSSSDSVPVLPCPNTGRRVKNVLLKVLAACLAVLGLAVVLAGTVVLTTRDTPPDRVDFILIALGALMTYGSKWVWGKSKS